MIHSNDGDIVRKHGDDYFTQNGVVRRVGSHLIGSDGSHAIDHGNIVQRKNDTIHVIGNQLHTGDGRVFRLEHDTLYGPNGKIWRGVSSMDDAKAIVAMRM